MYIKSILVFGEVKAEAADGEAKHQKIENGKRWPQQVRPR
jgi:hypothetical protein